MTLLLMKLLTHVTIHTGIFLSRILCSRCDGTTLSKAPVMLRESSVATPSLVCQVARICHTRKSRAMSIDLLGRAPMCSSDNEKICQAITLFSTFPSRLKSAMGHQAPEAEYSPLISFLKSQCCSGRMRWGGGKGWCMLERGA